MSEIIQKHHQNIANIYDNLWFYSEDFVQFITERIIEHLQLSVTDNLLDLGCGTGIYSQESNNQLKLDNAIICVDFSDKLFNRLSQTKHDILVHPYFALSLLFLSGLKGDFQLTIRLSPLY